MMEPGAVDDRRLTPEENPHAARLDILGLAGEDRPCQAAGEPA